MEDIYGGVDIQFQETSNGILVTVLRPILGPAAVLPAAVYGAIFSVVDAY